MSIDILLSTYNGEPFLEQLLQSLKDQSYTDWRLLVRDDGSTDRTAEIISDFSKEETERVVLIRDNLKKMGPKRSFETLLQSSTADYFMFCDQDDVWLNNKIQQTYDKMKELEGQSQGIPVLVFTDLTVADEKLNLLYPSFWNYTKVNPANIKNTYRLLINNPVVGCTVMINRAAKSVVLPFPDRALMHDRWMALKVAQEGVIDFLEKPTLFYRAHENNSIGVEAFNRGYVLRRSSAILETITRNVQVYKMAKELKKPVSLLKFVSYKIVITLSRMFK